MLSEVLILQLLNSTLPLRLDAVASVACRLQESQEEFFLDECESRGKTMHLVNPADFSFDAGWFAETREKLVRYE